jgi:hypothetical protein
MKLVVNDAAVANVLLLTFDSVLDGKAPQISHWINARAVAESVLLAAGADDISHTAGLDATVAEWMRLREHG